MRIIVPLVTLAISVTSGAHAQPTQVAAAAPTDEKKICQTQRITGSLTRVRRICMTRAEWAEQRQRSRQGVEDTQRAAGGGLKSSFDECNAPAAAMAGCGGAPPVTAGGGPSGF